MERLRAFVDPFLLTLPSENEERASVEAWIAALSGWVNAIRTFPLAWYHIIEATNTLNLLGRFPNFSTLRDLQARFDLDLNLGFLAGEIARFFQDEGRDYHSSSSLVDILARIEVTPGIVLSRNRADVRDELAHCLLFAAIDHSPKRGVEAIFVTAPMAAGAADVVEAVVVVEETVAASDAADVVAAVDVVAAANVVAAADVVAAAEELAPMISLEGELLETDPGEFLERCGTGLQRWAIPFATSPDGLGVGFSAKCAALGGANTFKFVIVSNLENSKYTNRQPFYVWREFVECIVRLGLVNNDAQMAKLIRFCVDVVVWDQPKLVRSYRLRPLRKAKDANATQRIRESDKAKAWRATVFSEGVGIRAHFWRRVRSEVDKPDSKFTEIEFANLVKKTDPEEIPLND